MNKDQKTAVIEEVASQIEGSEAVFVVDYRGISVPQVARLREKLSDAGARFRVVKNTLTIRAAEQAGADDLKELLEGPTAFTFVAADGGDVALAAKALAQFGREHEILDFKGGRMSGEPVSIDEIKALSRLPARNVLDSQLVGILASPVTGLVRGLNQLIAGLAMQLGQIAEQGLVSGEPPAEEAPAEDAPAEDAPAEEAPAEDAPAEDAPAEEAPAGEAEGQPAAAEEEAQDDAAPAEAEESAGGEGDEEKTSSEESTPPDDDTETPSEGEEQKEG